MNSVRVNKMNAEYIQQHNIAQRYLHGKLTPEETVEFEEYFLDKTELLEQLEVDSVLVEHLPKVKVEQKEKHLFPFLLRRFYLTVPAICSVMLLILLFAKSDSLHLVNTNSQIHYLENLRSANTHVNEKIIVEHDTKSLILVITPFVLSDRHEVRLVNPVTSEVLYSGVKKLSDFGQLNILIDSNLIDLGSMTLQIKPLAEDSGGQLAPVEVNLEIERRS